jgi:hypothetical protein
VRIPRNPFTVPSCDFQMQASLLQQSLKSFSGPVTRLVSEGGVRRWHSPETRSAATTGTVSPQWEVIVEMKKAQTSRPMGRIASARSGIGNRGADHIEIQ